VVLSKDVRIRRDRQERAILLEAGVKAFLLTQQGLTGTDMAAIFVKRCRRWFGERIGRSGDSFARCREMGRWPSCSSATAALDVPQAHMAFGNLHALGYSFQEDVGRAGDTCSLRPGDGLVIAPLLGIASHSAAREFSARSLC
jgi:hypothetical protein